MTGNTSLSSVVSDLVRAQMGTTVSSSVTDEDLDRHVAELILKEELVPGQILQPFQARKLAFGMDVPVASVNAAAAAMTSLSKAYDAIDGSLAEINPFILTKDGKVRWVEVYLQATLNSNGTVVGISGTLTDITERKQAEVQIQKLAAFPRVNPNPILEFALDGSLTYANDAAHETARTLGQAELLSILPANTGAIVRDCLATGQKKLVFAVQVHVLILGAVTSAFHSNQFSTRKPGTFLKSRRLAESNRASCTRAMEAILRSGVLRRIRCFRKMLNSSTALSSRGTSGHLLKNRTSFAKFS